MIDANHIVGLNFTTDDKDAIVGNSTTASRLLEYKNRLCLNIGNTFDNVESDVNDALNSVDFNIDNFQYILDNSIELKRINVDNIYDVNYKSINAGTFRYGLDSWESISNYKPMVLENHDTFKSLRGMSITGYDRILSKEIFPIHNHLEYRVNGFARSINIKDGSTTNKVRHYVGVACYDEVGYPIYPYHLTIKSNTLGTVDSDVAKGDTEIIVNAPYKSWYKGKYGHKRSFRVHKLRPDGSYGYIGENGKYHTPMGYTRDAVYYAYDEDGLTKIDTNKFKITLSKPIPFSIKAGDKICNSYGGGTFNYWRYGYFKDHQNVYAIKSKWKKQDLNTPTNKYYYLFRDGTAYVRFMSLVNYRYYDKDNNLLSQDDVKTIFYKLALEYRVRTE